MEPGNNAVVTVNRSDIVENPIQIDVIDDKVSIFESATVDGTDARPWAALAL